MTNTHGRNWDSEFDTLVGQYHLESTGVVDKSEPFTVLSKDGQPLFGRVIAGEKMHKVFVYTRWATIEHSEGV